MDRVYENGCYRDMTDEEIEFCKHYQETAEPIKPTFEEKIEAQVIYTAMMTDTLLEVD